MYYHPQFKELVTYEEIVNDGYADIDEPEPTERQYGNWFEVNGVMYHIYELHEKHTIDGCTLAIGHEEIIMVTPNGGVVNVYTR